MQRKMTYGQMISQEHKPETFEESEQHNECSSAIHRQLSKTVVPIDLPAIHKSEFVIHKNHYIIHKMIKYIVIAKRKDRNEIDRTRNDLYSKKIGQVVHV